MTTRVAHTGTEVVYENAADQQVRVSHAGTLVAYEHAAAQEIRASQIGVYVVWCPRPKRRLLLDWVDVTAVTNAELETWRDTVTRQPYGAANPVTRSGWLRGKFTIEGAIDSNVESTILSAFLSGRAVTVTYSPDGAAQYIASCYVAAFRELAGAQGATPFRATLESTGALTREVTPCAM